MADLTSCAEESLFGGKPQSFIIDNIVNHGKFGIEIDEKTLIFSGKDCVERGNIVPAAFGLSPPSRVRIDAQQVSSVKLVQKTPVRSQSVTIQRTLQTNGENHFSLEFSDGDVVDVDELASRVLQKYIEQLEGINVITNAYMVVQFEGNNWSQQNWILLFNRAILNRDIEFGLQAARETLASQQHRLQYLKLEIAKDANYWRERQSDATFDAAWDMIRCLYLMVHHYAGLFIQAPPAAPQDTGESDAVGNHQSLLTAPLRLLLRHTDAVLTLLKSERNTLRLLQPTVNLQNQNKRQRLEDSTNDALDVDTIRNRIQEVDELIEHLTSSRHSNIGAIELLGEHAESLNEAAEADDDDEEDPRTLATILVKSTSLESFVLNAVREMSRDACSEVIQLICSPEECDLKFDNIESLRRAFYRKALVFYNMMYDDNTDELIKKMHTTMENIFLYVHTAAQISPLEVNLKRQTDDAYSIRQALAEQACDKYRAYCTAAGWQGNMECELNKEDHEVGSVKLTLSTGAIGSERSIEDRHRVAEFILYMATRDLDTYPFKCLHLVDLVVHEDYRKKVIEMVAKMARKEDTNIMTFDTYILGKEEWFDGELFDLVNDH